ncbi:response regulator [Sphingomonas sp. LY29]|uniref:response regulator n=1 Tax=Sphingomonas sp. LY29 TaxID=3095341 RepID=UPI002D7690B4|nr:response regulator [Sphingomonas sp. LY29]WRP26363.1 response regulator [Sphingomonas sp. LY29]
MNESVNSTDRQSQPTVEHTLPRPRVLVVDDDERNLLAVSTVLEDIGEVVVANSGEEALRQLLKGEFAVILLDVFMPGLDGYETAQIIREREQTKRIPIVFLSAVNKETEHSMRGYAMGAVDYVFKPVDAVVLRSKVAVFVDLFAKTKEIERKAAQEQKLLDTALRANAERLRAEQELRRAEERQAAIIQSLPIVLYLEPLGCDVRCPNFVSGNFEAITGFKFADVLEQPKLWAERLHEEDRDRVLSAVAERDRTGRLSVEYRWQCADGKYRHFLDQAILLTDAAGTATEFAGTLTDVSERKSLEDQLVHSQKMDAIGKLTGGIAHDFNNLLAAVLGGLGMIERRANLAPDHLKILQMTKRAANQGSDLVSRLLAFARRQQLQPGHVEPADLAAAVDDLLAHTLGGLVTLTWEIPDKVWNCYADASQLELALMNLIINARDAMPDGGPITVSIVNQTTAETLSDGLAEGDYVLFEVRDAGCGISREDLRKVMEPFFTTKDLGKGTGLGLSMVYGFARQSGGTFEIESEVGKGSAARIWLPRALDVRQKDGRANETLQQTCASCRVILVDDHDEVRTATAGMLEDLGHRVKEFDSGEDALAAIRQAPSDFDIVITDYAMPNLNGLELIRRMRECRSDLPAIIVTGYADGDTGLDTPENVAVLLKPFEIEAVTAAINLVSEPNSDKSGGNSPA